MLLVLVIDQKEIFQGFEVDCHLLRRARIDCLDEDLSQFLGQLQVISAHARNLSAKITFDRIIFNNLAQNQLLGHHLSR